VVMPFQSVNEKYGDWTTGTVKNNVWRTSAGKR